MVANTRRKLPIHVLNGIEESDVLSNYTTFMKREDEYNKERDVQRTRWGGDNVLYEENTMKRRKFNCQVANVCRTRRRSEHIDIRYSANTGSTQGKSKAMDDQEIQMYVCKEECIVFEETYESRQSATEPTMTLTNHPGTE